jgi:outer membrane lipoprotein-sorting protein
MFKHLVLSLFPIVLAIPAATVLGQDANPRSDAPKDLKAIVEEAIKAAGGKDKLSKINAFSARVKMTFKEEKSVARYTAEVSVQGFDQIRIVMELEDKSKVDTTVINGDKGSMKAGTELLVMPEKMVNEYKNRLYGLRLMYTLTPLLEKDVGLAALAEIKVNDRPAVGMIVTKKDRPDIKLYFDKATKLPAQLEFEINAPGGKKTVVCIFGDYKEFNGIKHFTKVVSKTGKELTVEAEFADVKLLDKLDAKTFAE